MAAHADVLSLLIQEKRTVMGLAELTGATRQSITAWLTALEGEGLVQRHHRGAEKTGSQRPDLWEWLK